jgi:hypothetical protein
MSINNEVIDGGHVRRTRTMNGIAAMGVDDLQDLPDLFREVSKTLLLLT